MEKAGTNLHKIGRENGYAKTSAYDVLRWPNAKLERIVADILVLEPWDIWPSRYGADNKPITGLHTVKSR